MNDDLFRRANAYLDAGPTPGGDRRELVDVELADAVADLEQVRVRLRDVDPAPTGTMERMIETAMSRYTTSTVTGGDRSRPNSSTGRVLGLAAACIAVLAVGFVAARALQRSPVQDETRVGIEIAAEESAEESAAFDVADALTVGEPGVADPSEATAAAAAADDARSEIAASELTAATEEAASESTESMVVEDALEPRPVVELGEVLTTPEELGSVGSALLAMAEAGSLPPTPNTSCPVPGVLGRATYRLGESELDVLVAVEVEAGTVSAYDADTCGLVVSGPLFSD
ncbi:MAG: hypothetical protein ACO3WU_00615 [Ilumatobacteraceae bacterium]